MFFKGSRYEDVPREEIELAGGQRVAYKRIRLIPPTDPITAHKVVDGERLDHIAFRHFRDPERFWRICDANFALWPPELVAQPDRQLGIPTSGE